MNDETFAVLVQRYAEGELRAPDREALVQEVESDSARRAQFARQVRLNLELNALLQPEDAEDARLRASLIVSEDEDARDRRVMASLEKKLDLRLRRSTRSMKIVRPPPAPPRIPVKLVAAAAIVVALTGALLMIFSGGAPEEPVKPTVRSVRETPVRPAPEVQRPVDFSDREREAAEAKQRERARRMAEERAAMEREAKEEPKPATSRPSRPRRNGRRP